MPKNNSKLTKSGHTTFCFKQLTCFLYFQQVWQGNARSTAILLKSYRLVPFCHILTSVLWYYVSRSSPRSLLLPNKPPIPQYKLQCKIFIFHTFFGPSNNSIRVDQTGPRPLLYISSSIHYSLSSHHYSSHTYLFWVTDSIVKLWQDIDSIHPESLDTRK